jgi:hypothetical protein
VAVIPVVLVRPAAAVAPFPVLRTVPVPSVAVAAIRVAVAAGTASSS